MDLRHRLINALLMMLALSALSTVGYMLIGDHVSFLQALYMVAVTVMGNSAGEEILSTANHPGLRIFNIGVIILGWAIAAYVLASITTFLVEGEITNIFWRRKMQKRISELKQHYVVCGLGDTGRHAVEELQKTHTPYVVIETHEESVQRLRESEEEFKDLPYVIGDATDDLVLELFPQNHILDRWIKLARKRIKFQGFPARICWLGYGERAKFGLAINDLVRNGKIKAPVVMGRDHLDCGSVASPYRETESMKDGSDAVADWPILNALLNTASGASWVSVHNGGGVGIGYSLHAGQVTVADGSEAMARRIERVLTNDPGIGVARHVDAGYEEAVRFADQKGIHVPLMNTPRK